MATTLRSRHSSAAAFVLASYCVPPLSFVRGNLWIKYGFFILSNRGGFMRARLVGSVSLLGDVPSLKNKCHERALPFIDFNCFRWSFNAFSTTPFMSLNFFNGNETGTSSEVSGKPLSNTVTKGSSGRKRWTWTHSLVTANVLIHAAQYLPKPNVTFWFSKRNSCIKKGQWWRLVTCAFLHANISHLLVNFYSLNSVGPVIEKIWGPERFLTIYLSSAVAGSTMSYWFNKNHSIGASGAICGLIGAYSVFLLRNRDRIQRSDDHLKNVGIVIITNMVIGLVLPGIDNWAHLGGFIGGAAISYLLNPAWEIKPVFRIKEVPKVDEISDVDGKE